MSAVRTLSGEQDNVSKMDENARQLFDDKKQNLTKPAIQQHYQEEIMETIELYALIGNIILSLAVCFGPYLLPDVKLGENMREDETVTPSGVVRNIHA